VILKNGVTDAGDLVGFYYLGELEESRGNAEASLKAFEDAAQAAPMIAEPHYNLALQYQKRALHEQAVQSLQAAVALQGDMVDARYRLAAELAGLGRLEEALTQLEAVQQLRPGYQNSTEHLANIRRLLGR
jgi:tetratricopeptide (TPR) repeat protein